MKIPLLRPLAGFALAALASCGGSAPSATARDDTPVIHEFAQLPVTPGQPGGIVVDGDTVYVDTFGFVTRPADGSDNLYAFDARTGVAVRPEPFVIPRRFPVCIMGLSGMAADAAGRIYMVDMNARVMRLDPRSGVVDDYASFPTGVAGPVPSMPLDIAFDTDGSAYVSDIGGAPVIWRIPAGGGVAEVWRTDPAFAGVWSQGGGGLRVDAANRRLLVGIVTGDTNMARGSVYAVPLDGDGAPVLFHSYANNVESPPLGSGPLGITLGASGRLYVALPGTSEVSVLRPDGSEERRIVFPASTQFVALTAAGKLLVTAWNFPDGPWPVYEVDVGDAPATVRPVIQ